MANFNNPFRIVLVALCVISLDQVFVDAMISKSMFITWGKQHAKINGEDLQLVLDQTSGDQLISHIITFLIRDMIRYINRIYSNQDDQDK